MKISEVAARTGFSASTLRCYEDVGLVSPGRTDAGYRVYDPRAVDRIEFIGRAKHLGLALDEIAELVRLWDGDQCDPVADRLHGLAADKLDQTERHIALLATFAAELRRAVSSLGSRHVDGPCEPSTSAAVRPRLPSGRRTR